MNGLKSSLCVWYSETLPKYEFILLVKHLSLSGFLSSIILENYHYYFFDYFFSSFKTVLILMQIIYFSFFPLCSLHFLLYFYLLVFLFNILLLSFLPIFDCLIHPFCFSHISSVLFLFLRVLLGSLKKRNLFLRISVNCLFLNYIFFKLSTCGYIISDISNIWCAWESNLFFVFVDLHLW